MMRRVNPPEHASVQHFDNLNFDEAQFEKLIDHLAD
jgi:hypothetical protein